MKTQTIYTARACENLMQRYAEQGGKVCTLEEGTAGLGLVICYGEGFKTTVITECLNCWETVYTIRMYTKMPAKYSKMLKNLNREE